jgi:hypothetical protein
MVIRKSAVRDTGMQPCRRDAREPALSESVAKPDRAASYNRYTTISQFLPYDNRLAVLCL